MTANLLTITTQVKIQLSIEP